MRAAFTKKRSGGWPKAVKNKGKELKARAEEEEEKAKEKGIELPKYVPPTADQLDTAVTLDREGERLALVEWLHAGADKQAYDDDKFKISADLASPTDHRQVCRWRGKEADKYAKIRSIITDRCVRCHGDGAGFGAAQYPLTNWEEVSLYIQKEKGTGMSLPKLAQTSHVHLLGFAMLWGMTGFIFALSSFPTWLRVIVAPAALIGQMVDISFWWLARVDTHGPTFAQAITITGGVVGLAPAVQIFGSLFNLFGKKGKAVLALILLVSAGLGGVVFVKVVEPYQGGEGGDEGERGITRRVTENQHGCVPCFRGSFPDLILSRWHRESMRADGVPPHAFAVPKQRILGLEMTRESMAHNRFCFSIAAILEGCAAASYQRHTTQSPKGSCRASLRDCG